MPERGFSVSASVPMSTDVARLGGRDVEVWMGLVAACDDGTMAGWYHVVIDASP